MPQEGQPPTGKNLLDAESREKLPPLYSGEALGLLAMAIVKFFTPDAGWIWYASEFDGEDIFFGLVSGFKSELNDFFLKNNYWFGFKIHLNYLSCLHIGCNLGAVSMETM